jgi:uncharacterized protein (TIGR02646 family)
VRSIRKGTPPEDIRNRAQTWRREYESTPAVLTNTGHARNRFDEHDKKASRAALCVEQTGLCAFCLGRIRPEAPVADSAGMRLAHVIPLQVEPRRIFDWDNLLGACRGGTGTALHCDVLQGNRSLFINPALVPELERHIRYSSRGVLSYMGPPLCGRTREQIQQEFDVVLGLNIERLRMNREAILAAAKREMERLGWTRSNLEREIRRWSTPGPDGYMPYFCVAVFYLEKKLAAQP